MNGVSEDKLGAVLATFNGMTEAGRAVAESSRDSSSAVAESNRAIAESNREAGRLIAESNREAGRLIAESNRAVAESNREAGRLIADAVMVLADRPKGSLEPLEAPHEKILRAGSRSKASCGIEETVSEEDRRLGLVLQELYEPTNPSMGHSKPGGKSKAKRKQTPQIIMNNAVRKCGDICLLFLQDKAGRVYEKRDMAEIISSVDKALGEKINDLNSSCWKRTRDEILGPYIDRTPGGPKSGAFLVKENISKAVITEHYPINPELMKNTILVMGKFPKNKCVIQEDFMGSDKWKPVMKNIDAGESSKRVIAYLVRSAARTASFMYRAVGNKSFTQKIFQAMMEKQDPNVQQWFNSVYIMSRWKKVCIDEGILEYQGEPRKGILTVGNGIRNKKWYTASEDAT